MSLMELIHKNSLLFVEYYKPSKLKYNHIYPPIPLKFSGQFTRVIFFKVNSD